MGKKTVRRMDITTDETMSTWLPSQSMSTDRVNYQNYRKSFDDTLEWQRLNNLRRDYYHDLESALKLHLKQVESNHPASDRQLLLKDFSFSDNEITELDITPIKDINQVSVYLDHDYCVGLLDNLVSNYNLNLKNNTLNLRPRKNEGAELPVRNPDAVSSSRLRHGGSIWVSPPCRDGVVDTKATPITDKAEKIIKLWIRSAMGFSFGTSKSVKKVKLNSKNQKNTNNFTGSFLVSLDVEWKNTSIGQTTQERKLTDVLSYQLSAVAVEKTGNQITNNIVSFVVQNFNTINGKVSTSNEHFRFAELEKAIIYICTLVTPKNPDGTIPNVPSYKVMLVTYFGGVDLSAFAGWQKELRGMIVQGKHHAASIQPMTFDVNDSHRNSVKLSLLVRDMGLLAPPGGLKALGELVGISKIDTEVWDRQDNRPIGFYKSHMDVLRRMRPHDYDRYSLNDAIITLKYCLELRESFDDWKVNMPMTLGSYAAKMVFNIIHNSVHSRINESIWDPALKPSEIADCLGDQGVREGQLDLFSQGIKAYYGGYNVAMTSGWSNGRLIDSDLTSAYNMAGHLLPRLDYSDTNYEFLENGCELDSKIEKQAVKLDSSTSFEQLAKVLDRNPFVVGIGQFKIKYPDDAEIVVTPSHSHNKNYGPCYVREIDDKLTLIDAYNAFIHHAQVKIIDLRIPKQSFADGLNAYGEFQNAMLIERNKGKKLQKTCNPHSSDYMYHQFRQLLFKLIGNTVYGKAGQGTSATKRTRNYGTGQEESIPYCCATDPVIAASYTAYTRYLVNVLFDAVRKIYKGNEQSLNITTDGYTFILPEKIQFDTNAVNDAFMDRMCKHYKQRLKFAFGNSGMGFELKGNCIDKVFNTRTRFNGSYYHEKGNGGIKATASVNGYAVKRLYKMITHDVIMIENKENHMTNLTEMKFSAKNKNHGGGTLVTTDQVKEVGLQYDFSQEPIPGLHVGKDICYFDTRPFRTVDQHDQYKEQASLLAKQFPIYQSSKRYQAFLDSMEKQLDLKSSQFKFHKIDNEYDLLCYCYQHWLWNEYGSKDKAERKREIELGFKYFNPQNKPYSRYASAIRKNAERSKSKGYGNVNDCAVLHFEEITSKMAFSVKLALRDKSRNQSNVNSNDNNISSAA